MSLHGLLSLAGIGPQAEIPAHCEPANEFLYNLSVGLQICVPSNLALISTLLGTCSIVAWLFAQLPQIYKNFKLHSTSGLSVYFLGEWLLGDVSNLIGCMFTGQATWQVVIATYYCFVDCMLMGQYIWYEGLHHGRPMKRIWWPRSKENRDQDVVDGMSIYSQSTSNDDNASVVSKPIDTPTKSMVKPEDVRGHFRMPRYSASPATRSLSDSLGTTPTQRGLRVPSGTSPSPSPRTVLYISLLLAVVAQASPVSTTQQEPASTNGYDPLAIFGTVMSWLSTLLYLGSRLPQLYKNHVRKSTAGLSPALFIAAFFGNLFYSSSMLTNPNVWSDFPAYGGGGWAGEDGNDQKEWVGRAAPFFLGAAGVLVMDASVGIQFMMFSESKQREPVMVVAVERAGRKWKWRRVSGWMRGWMPSVSATGTPIPGTPAFNAVTATSVESRPLLGTSEGGQQAGYGSV